MSEIIDDVFIAPRRLRDLAREMADRVPLAVAGSSGPITGLTYAQWNTRADEIAAGLLRRQVRPGDRVALMFEGMAWDEYAPAYSAVHRVGATALQLSPPLGRAEIRRRCAEVAPIGILHGPGLAADANDTGTGAWVVRARDAAVHGAGPVDGDVGPQTLADIFYTSGTTGPAKAICVSHGNLGYGRGLNRVAAEAFDLQAPIVAPMPLGTAPSAGMVAIFAETTTSTIVVCPADDAEQVAAAVARSRAGSLMVTPALLMAMIDQRAWERHDLSSLTSIGVASAALPSRYGRALAAQLPHAGVMVTYGGGSEAIPANIRGAYDPQHPGRMGRPSPGTRVRLVDPSADVADAAHLPPVPAGTPGRVVLAHEAPPRQFLDPRNDVGVYVDGWVVTNDLATIDPDDDTFVLVDRAEDALAGPDGPISSLAAENLLFEHPQVREAAVVTAAGSDQRIGFAVLATGSTATADEVLAAATAAAAATRASARIGVGDSPAAPDRVELLPALPRGPLGGKVLKRVLRERLLSP